MNYTRDRRSQWHSDPRYMALVHRVEQALAFLCLHDDGTVRIYPLTGEREVGVGVIAEDEAAAATLELRQWLLKRALGQAGHVVVACYHWYVDADMNKRTTLLLITDTPWIAQEESYGETARHL